MQKFSQWFKDKLLVTGFPYPADIEEKYKHVDVFINVSDEFHFDHHCKVGGMLDWCKLESINNF